MLTAVDQRERSGGYGGGGYGGRRSQDSGGWWGRDRDGYRDGGGRGRDIGYDHSYSDSYGRRGSYSRWGGGGGGEKREDADTRQPRSVDWNVLLPVNERLEK